MPSLPDVSAWLLYDETAMDTRKALWFVADAQNAVCLAYGAGFENFRDAEPFLSAFPSVFLALSDRDTAEAVADALKEYTPSVAVLLPKEGAFGKCSRIRDVLASGGRKAVDHLLLGAVEQPMDGLLDLADVERRDPGASVAVMSGLKALDQSIGGFAPSELSVWTGKRGSGKSTLLSQLLLNAIDQGFPVCAYSGELSAWRFKQWAMLQGISSRSGTRRPGSCITTRRRRSRTGSTVGGRGSFSCTTTGWPVLGTRTASFPCSSMPFAGSAAVYFLWTT